MALSFRQGVEEGSTGYIRLVQRQVLNLGFPDVEIWCRQGPKSPPLEACAELAEVGRGGSSKPEKTHPALRAPLPGGNVTDFSAA